jgi:hypothetical protein
MPDKVLNNSEESLFWKSFVELLVSFTPPEVSIYCNFLGGAPPDFGLKILIPFYVVTFSSNLGALCFMNLYPPILYSYPPS